MVPWVVVSILCLAACFQVQARKEFRGRGRVSPVSHVLTTSTIKPAVTEKLASFDVPLGKRTLIVYHVGYLSIEYSTSVIINNVKLLRSAVLSHVDSTHVEGLYIFNVLGGESNPFYSFLPCEVSNVLCVHLEHEIIDYDLINDFETHKDLMDILGEDTTKKFSNVLFLTYEARGPFDKEINGEWLLSFTRMLGQPHPSQRNQPVEEPAHSNHAQVNVANVYKYVSTKPIGAVTTGISCDGAPRMLTHAFALSSALVHKTFALVNTFITNEAHGHNRTEQLGGALTEHLLKQGISIASLVQQARLLAPLKLNADTIENHNPLTDLPTDLNQAEQELWVIAPELRNKDNLKHSKHQKHQKHHRQLSAATAVSPAQLNNLVNAATYDNRCLTTLGTLGATTNPLLWCNLVPKEMMFIKFGGNVLKHPGILCDEALRTIAEATIALGTKHNLKLELPETLYGGIYKDLYRQYALENWQWHHAHVSVPKQVTSRHEREAKKEPLVCFMVRSASVHSAKVNVTEGPSRLVKMDLDLLILTLTKQTNPHWKAYFFVTDEKPFDQELQHLLHKHNDARLVYLDVPLAHRPAFTVIDAGYTATDYAMSKVLKDTSCRWISLSNGDNAYGSRVVDNVLHAKSNVVTGDRPNMVLAPLDSRNWAEQDYLNRAALKAGKTGGWRERCVGIETSLRVHNFVYTVQPVPIVGRVDLAAVFLDAVKFKQEQLFFSNFSDVTKYACKGCQDGYLTESLVAQRHWSYFQLPIDGLKSMVFHGPSPTLCVASGNVWFDFPEVNKLGCISHRTIGNLQPAHLYDLNRFFDAKSHRVCLRLSQKGYWNRTGSVIT